MSKPWKLELSGDGARTIELPENGMLVIGGSSERAGLVISGQGVDDAHCAVGRVKSGGWAIKDLGSRYGTLVNGSRVTSQKLSGGDQIILGSRRLQVIDPADPDAKPEPAPEPKSAPKPTPKREPAQSAPNPASALPKISGYRVERILGRGGMGHVYLAVQESLSRPVALKLLTGKFATDLEFVKRFQSEARAAAAWNHPNVVVVHDVGDSNGLHFLSMEYMPGGNLEQVVASQGPLSWRRVLDVLHDAAGGLAYAEAQGILHRDIKPANLMLSESGSVKIADLGLATQVESQGTEAEGLGGKIYGTPHFISPEQARGDRVDHRSDLYSLGATAYRLLSGQTPFQGETTREIVIARFTSDPVPVAELVAEIPAELSELVMRLMAREPGDRFASADDLQKDVDRLRLRADHGDPVVVQEKPASKLPLLIGVAVVVLVGAGLAVKSMLGGGEAPGGTQASEVADNDVDPLDVFTDDESFFGNGDEDSGDSDTDEADLENLNLRAKLAYAQIPATYTDEERIDALREVAANFDGTDTATQASTEASNLETELARSRAAEKQLTGEIQKEIDRLKAAAKWPPAEGELPKPGPALVAMENFRPLAGIAFDPRFTDARDELAATIISDSDTAFQAELARAEGLAASGDFAGVRTTLEALSACFELPPQKDGELSGLSALRRLGDEISARMDSLEAEEARFLSKNAAREREALGQTLGPDAAFADSLRALEFDSLLTQLDALAATLKSPDARATFDAVREDVARGRSALAVLVDSFAAGEWRRRAIADPRPRRSGAADIIAVDMVGVTLSIDGQAQPLPWSAFGTDTKAIEQLFKGRLSRAYNAEEDAAIATLLRLVAVGEATDIAGQVLDPGQNGILQPSEVTQMQTAFDPADAWVSDAGAGVLAREAERVQRERKAASILAEALLASQGREVSRAVAEFEYLFDSYGDTFVVLLLSDGSGWRAEVPEAPEETIAPEDAPQDGAPENGSGSEESKAQGENGE